MCVQLALAFDINLLFHWKFCHVATVLRCGQLCIIMNAPARCAEHGLKIILGSRSSCYLLLLSSSVWVPARTSTGLYANEVIYSDTEYPMAFFAKSGCHKMLCVIAYKRK